MAHSAPDCLTTDVNPVQVILENETCAKDFQCTDNPTTNIEIAKTVMEQTEELKSKTRQSPSVQDDPKNGSLFTAINENHGEIGDIGQTTNHGEIRDISQTANHGEIRDISQATNQHDSAVPVCQSCQHLYGKTSTVVLTPSTLCHTHAHAHANAHANAQHQTSFLSSLKPWKTRRYEDLSGCSENGSECQDNKTGNQTSIWLRLLPRNAPWWPRTKLILLIIAGILPWVFLAIYLVYTFKVKSHDKNP
ncbi:uncharacterized protein [Procambarus clarkii]|uniref:uncharacterized protein isoform X1 n=1 Tax=Procambarus clarkii TaxID=6728 RepID=UPI003742890E